MMYKIAFLLASLSLCDGALVGWQNCVKPTNTSRPVLTVRGCEKKEDVVISCKPGYKISIIKAFFGHGYGFKSSCDSSVFGQNCASIGAPAKIRHLCQDQPSCTITPTSNVLGTTSCVFGLYSDLIVEYSCHPETISDSIFIKSLKVGPNPIVFPGKINVSVDALVSRHLPRSTKVRLNVKSKVLGAVWVSMPCISGFGSCTYENFCDLVRNKIYNKCDRDMENAGIPCDCPIPTGLFTIPTQVITVTKEQIDEVIPVMDVLVTGQYRVKVEYLDAYDRILGCFTLAFDLDINSYKEKRELRLKMV